MQIEIEDLIIADIQGLLREHLDDMRQTSPPESVHALDMEALRRPDVTFWAARQDSELSGCGALRELHAHAGEIKSMRTAKAHLRKGIAAAILPRILAEARRRGYRRVNLETGRTMPFRPAHKLYQGFGFVECAPFGDYREDPFSVCMTRMI